MPHAVNEYGLVQLTTLTYWGVDGCEYKARTNDGLTKLSHMWHMRLAPEAPVLSLDFLSIVRLARLN